MSPDSHLKMCVLQSKSVKVVCLCFFYLDQSKKSINILLFSSEVIFNSLAKVIYALMVISETQWPLQESVFAY